MALAETLPTQQEGDGFKITGNISYPIYVDTKLDGLRLIAVKSKGEVTLYTRNGSVLETLPRIAAAVAALPQDNIVFDGEGMASSWEDSSSVMMSSKSKKDDAGMRYHIFDVLPLQEWIDQRSDALYHDRLLTLKLILGKLPSDSPLVPVVGEIVHGEATLRHFYERSLDRGFEGIMVKVKDFNVSSPCWTKT